MHSARSCAHATYHCAQARITVSLSVGHPLRLAEANFPPRPTASPVRADRPTRDAEYPPPQPNFSLREENDHSRGAEGHFRIMQNCANGIVSQACGLRCERFAAFIAMRTVFAWIEPYSRHATRFRDIYGWSRLHSSSCARRSVSNPAMAASMRTRYALKARGSGRRRSAGRRYLRIQG